jgi:hypothetical protein
MISASASARFSKKSWIETACHSAAFAAIFLMNLEKFCTGLQQKVSSIEKNLEKPT